jgi:hypothetical protein
LPATRWHSTTSASASSRFRARSGVSGSGAPGGTLTFGLTAAPPTLAALLIGPREGSW